ncbi:YbaN family protein [Vibrio ishigakensis]|uniref:YbaN family protein n=1 Tax=Vibrio ishigakensis TaxID=1481914 RepID=UPI000AA6F60F|nr:YbaN family protein [Vibrio ishigakensis]
MIKALWVTAGSVSLGLGLLGILLPLLPTTPFILLASACYMRGSTRLHNKMLSHPTVGPIIINWRASRSIEKGVKRKAYVFIVLSFTFSIFMAPIIWVKVLLGVIFILLMTWFIQVPETNSSKCD